jgi:hypothetical protein
MAKTDCIIQFGLVDVTMKGDSTLVISEMQPFINPDDLKQNFIKTKNYATLEPDKWRADGLFSTIDEKSYGGFGLWSLNQSNAIGVFDTPVIMTITFGSLHTTKGITLDFSPYEDWSNEVNIKWYSGATLKINKTFYPDKNIYLCEQLVEAFGKLVITFVKTSKPYRYLKLKRIIYGEEVTFSGETLVSATVLEEINPISSELSINTLNFRLLSNDAKFSIINPQGIYAALQQMQPISVTENIDGVEQGMGTFYLTEWENQSETQIKMEAVDLVGIMDKTMFKGDVYSGVLSQDIIGMIMNSISVPYEIHESLKNIPIDGWIPHCTHREALQQVAFALGAMVDTSRNVLVSIIPMPSVVESTITLAEKLTGGKVTLLPFVTGVELLEHNFVRGTESVSLYNGPLSTGTYTIFFNEPAHTLSITGGTIASGGANHAVIIVPSTATVQLNGKKYIDTSVIVAKNNPNLVATDKTNILNVSGAYMISKRNSTDAINRIYNYYQNRIQQEFSLLPKDINIGEYSNIETIYETTKLAIIESLEIDLVGGFVQKVVAKGA